MQVYFTSHTLCMSVTECLAVILNFWSGGGLGRGKNCYQVGGSEVEETRGIREGEEKSFSTSSHPCPHILPTWQLNKLLLQYSATRHLHCKLGGPLHESMARDLSLTYTYFKIKLEYHRSGGNKITEIAKVVTVQDKTNCKDHGANKGFIWNILCLYVHHHHHY